jgi:hypothetical protein
MTRNNDQLSGLVWVCERIEQAAVLEQQQQQHNVVEACLIDVVARMSIRRL